MNALSAKEIVKESLSLFSLPDIYFQITKMINDPSYSAVDIGKVISKDPALSARLLKIVNSSFYGFQARVDTISRAITIVGIDDLKSLVLTTSVIDSFSKIPSDLVDMTLFWLRSIHCGILAKLLAKKSSVSHCERLFLCGLLHDLGSLVLYSKLPDQSLEVLLAADHDRRLVAGLEQEIIGLTHADVSSALIQHWGLPEALVETIACYLNPEAALDYKLDACLLALATRLVDMVQQNSSVAEILEEFPDSVEQMIRLDADQIDSVLAEADEELAQVFDLIVPEKPFTGNDWLK